MSLKLAAQHLSNQGRGPDDTLVHMSKNELRSLNDLAMAAHGGQLTINPETGLPEANLLEKFLPAVVGAGLTYFSGGAINPMTAGFITGGIETVRSGSIEKGLMAGLGAYGGAGLTAGLAGAGAAEIGMSARDAAIQNATQQGLTGEAYNTAIQQQVAQQMAEKATPFGQISEGASQLFKEPGKVVDAMGGGFSTAKYAAGAAAPYLADALAPNVEMPDPRSLQKPVEYRQYKVKRRPDLSYEYTPLPVSNTFTPNFAEGGGISDLVNPYLDPSFKFKNVGGPPKVETTTHVPELKLADGGKITPEKFYQQYMQQGQNPVNLKYGTRGYPDTDPNTYTKTPYERPTATPGDIVGVDGETYTWDPITGKYVLKPKINVPDSPKDTDKKTEGISTAIPGGDPNAVTKMAIQDANMTPAEKETQKNINNAISNFTPMAVEITKKVIDKFFPDLNPTPAVSSGPASDGGEPIGTVTVGEGEAVDGDTSITPPNLTITPDTAPTDTAPSATSSGVSNAAANTAQGISAANAAAAIGAANAAGNAGAAGTSAGPGGMAGTVGAPGVAASVAAGNTGAAGAAGPGSSGGGGSVGGPSGMGGMGTGAAAAGVSAGVSGVGPGGGSSGSSGSGMGGMGTGAAGAATSGGVSGVGPGGGGSSGGGGGSSGSSGSGMGGMGTGAAGAGVSAGVGGVGGGGGGGGGGCCFIMLEARYGDGTMDRVVRRYRDEKVTERNKRGYYKLAEVLIPLMRKSKLFSFLVVKTFADPAVCYAKWYYGENKWGWVFKPLERFWMGLFDTLGTETKFIRENGEVV